MTEPCSAAAAVRAQLENDGLEPEFIRWYEMLYQHFTDGETGLLPWDAISSPGPHDIVDMDDHRTEAHHQRGIEALDGLAVVVLNGGLGTSMKLQSAKSLIPVRGGESFLGMACRHLAAMREATGAALPLILMNSARTQADSLAALDDFSPWHTHPEGLARDFLQHHAPRLDPATHGPAALSECERWCPPGHGDIYLAIHLSGVLRDLIARGFRWALVRNSDNLGASVDPAILGYLEAEELDFAMEVTAKTRADCKGGTLVRHQGALTLLERAQVEPERIPEFEDIEAFKVFNTNTLWWRLEAVLARLEAGILPLPMIVNPKTIEDTEIVQLEVAMGAAIGAFPRARGLRVGRHRFAPVKTTKDLLRVRSDLSLPQPDGTLTPNLARDPTWGPPIIEFDAEYYQGIADFEARFRHPLGLVAARSLRVLGDVTFGAGVVIQGDVTIQGPGHIADGSCLSNETVTLD